MYEWSKLDDRLVQAPLGDKLGAALEEILKGPRSGKPLREVLVGLWSYRIGKYRLIYRIERRQIDLIAFGPRDRIYEETYRLVAHK
ncbi:MAG TPA: type II toxin-antitoxin system RelE/ParE family toxin [Burkholderiales bacterium]|nr:type II toxin-antitoxin system RelE/ParE family toxin [Burkholderiales bacterium]